MVELSRRGFIFGAAATIAIIRTPSLIMPIKALVSPPKKTLGLPGVLTTRINGILVIERYTVFDHGFGKMEWVPLEVGMFKETYPNFGKLDFNHAMKFSDCPNWTV